MANMENRKLRVPLTNLANLTLTLHSMIDILKLLDILRIETVRAIYQTKNTLEIWATFDHLLAD